MFFLKYTLHFLFLAGYLFLFACSSSSTTLFNGIQLKRVFPDLSFNSPLLLLQHPSITDRWYVLEQSGRIKTFQTTDTSSSDFADLTPVVNYGGEKGLLGMAFHPDFSSNNYIYVYYSTVSNSAANHDSVIMRYSATNAGTLNISSGTEIMRIPQPYSNHNGGNIVFGADGYLYIGTGDGGSGGDPDNNAQNINSLLGKMLRIDVDNGTPYSIPADNPFANTSGADEIYAYGLRNPWRWSFDRVTNNLIVADVGQNAWEEIDLIVRGGNYGWRCREGAHDFNTSGCNATYIDPIYEYDQDTSRMPGGFSVTGGYVYRGRNIPGLSGSYIFADYVSARIWRLEDPYGTPAWSELTDGTGFGLASFAEDNAGEIYAIDLSGGGIYRLDPAP